MARQQGPGSHETYEGPERRHVVPCEGLIELQRAAVRFEAEMQGFRDHSIRQNGSIQKLDVKTDRIEDQLGAIANKADLIDAKVQSDAEDRQRQIGGVVKDVDNIRKNLSDYHDETLREVAKTAQDTTRTIVGAAIVGLALLGGAVITLLTKLGGLP